MYEINFDLQNKNAVIKVNLVKWTHCWYFCTKVFIDFIKNVYVKNFQGFLNFPN